MQYVSCLGVVTTLFLKLLHRSPNKVRFYNKKTIYFQCKFSQITLILTVSNQCTRRIRCICYRYFSPSQFKLGSLDVTPMLESERAPVYCRMFDSLLSVSDSCRERAETSNRQSEEERKISKAAIQVSKVNLILRSYLFVSH